MNVHPSKTEVRFRHGSLVHDFVRDTVREVLMAQRPVPRLASAAPAQVGAELPYSEFSQRIENMNYSAVDDACRLRRRFPSRLLARLRGGARVPAAQASVSPASF